MTRKTMTEEQANAVYQVLIDICGAPECDRSSFVYEFTTVQEYGPTNEWRFGGHLGFGGKFRFPGFSVTCYREDETDNIRNIIVKANEQLVRLK